MSNHIAVIPARLRSKGFKFKNRLFFQNTAEFVRSSQLYDRVIVTTDDPILLEFATAYGFETHRRPTELAGDHTSIREVFFRLVQDCSVMQDDYLWLFYIPLVYKNVKDFAEAKMKVEKCHPLSLSSFIPAKTHPYNCWRYGSDQKKLKKYIENDLFNRQDYPEAWENYHYIYCCLASALPQLDNNLLCADTRPFFLPEETVKQLVEIDTPADLERWKYVSPKDYECWLKTQVKEKI